MLQRHRLSEDACFLVRQHAWCTRKRIHLRSLSQADLVLKSSAIFFFPFQKMVWLLWAPVSSLVNTAEALCRTGMLGSVRGDKSTHRCLGAHSPQSVCRFLSAPSNAFYQEGSRSSKCLRSVSFWVCTNSGEGAVHRGRSCICEYCASMSLTVLEIFCFRFIDWSTILIYPYVSSDTSIYWSFWHPWTCGYW